MDRRRIAHNLKRIRGNKTQNEVATAVGVSPSAYAMYETGQRIPRDDVKVKIASYFNMSVGDIFFN